MTAVEELAWDGVLLPKDADFWKVANPMNGWGCKCYTRFVSRAQYRRYVDRGIPQLTPGDGKRGLKKVITEEPALHPVPYRNEATGQSHTGYEGIDHGFERNPGVGRMEQLSEAFWRKDQAAQSKLEPIGPAVRLLLPKDGDRAFRRPAQHALDAIARVHGTGDDSLRAAEVERLPDDQESNGRYVPRDDQPTDLILLKPTGDTPYLTAAHEIGHLIQRRALSAGEVSQLPAHLDTADITFDRIASPLRHSLLPVPGGSRSPNPPSRGRSLDNLVLGVRLSGAHALDPHRPLPVRAAVGMGDVVAPVDQDGNPAVRQLMGDVPDVWRRRVAAELLGAEFFDCRQPIRAPGIVGIYLIFVRVSHPCASNRLSNRQIIGKNSADFTPTVVPAAGHRRPPANRTSHAGAAGRLPPMI